MTSARSLSFIVVLAVLVAANSAIRADIIKLRDGSIQEGEVVYDNADMVTLRIRVGANSGTVDIPRREIVSIQSKAMPRDPVLVEGVTLQKKAEAAETNAQKAEAWVKVGEFYGRHEGYVTLANAAFTKALMFDSNHPVARVRLGFEKTNAGWVELQKAKPKDEVALVEKPQAPESELVIGMRRDEQVIRNIIEKQQERKQQQEMPPPVQQGWNEQRPPFTAYGYASDNFYIGPNGEAYYVPYGLIFGSSAGYAGGLPFQPIYGYGYGNSGGYRHSGSGLSVGFRGNFGNVRVNGSFNGGSSFSSSSGWFGGGGHRGRSGF